MFSSTSDGTRPAGKGIDFVIMKILIACEESQTICVAMCNHGHEAYSADLQPCSGGFPEWHILGDVLPLINGRCSFTTMDGKHHEISGKWDMIIAHPPCTYLSFAGNRYLSPRFNSPEKIADRLTKRDMAFQFFMRFINADCDKICVENPRGYPCSAYRKADQEIHPYYFASGVDDSVNYHLKRTCLWLKGLPPLERSTYLSCPLPLYYSASGKARYFTDCSHGSFIRSKTFPGVAAAMASQWSDDFAPLQLSFFY